MRGEKFRAFDNGHLEDIVDVFAFIEDGERFFIKAFSFAMLAVDPFVFHEVHVDFDHSHAAAVGA